MYRTIWRRETDGLTHRATVDGNATDGYEIRSDCGLVGNACWEAQLAEDAEITCPRCRTIGRANQSEEMVDTGQGKSPAASHIDNEATDTTSPTLFEGADVIHSYTRKQAIADGVLVDVTTVAKEAGIRYPTALTQTVWGKYVEVPPEVEAQDEAGRLWDILWMMKWAIATSRDDGDALKFQLHVRNNNKRAELVTLKAICGPDDDANPCITVLLPDED